jgi:hypothetical protein
MSKKPGLLEPFLGMVAATGVAVIVGAGAGYLKIAYTHAAEAPVTSNSTISSHARSCNNNPCKPR